MSNTLFRTKVKEALIEAIHERVKDAYGRSQVKVPVDTGDLKRSGTEEDLDNGAKVEYKKEYASIVERGFPEHYEQIKGHYKKNGVFVRNHTRKVKERKPVNYIKDSFEGSFERFSTNFESNLRNKFKSVVKK